MKVIIAASQTGGHINPGIAIANKIKEENKDAEIIFIGTKRGLENDLVPRAGYKLRTIEAYGIVRKISIDNFKKMLKTLKGYGEAKNFKRGKARYCNRNRWIYLWASAFSSSKTKDSYNVT